MRKIFLFLLPAFLLLVGVEAWGATSTVTASKVTSSSFSWTGSGSVAWTGTVNGGATNQNMNSGYAQVGTSSSPSTSITISTSGISGTISSIVIDCAAYQGKATVSATVDGKAFGTQNQSVPSWSNNSGDEVTFTGSASGAIVITMTNGSGGRAMYIKSIVVTYTAGYSVIYNANGATSGTVPTDETSYSSGATVTVLGNTNGLVKTGYAFDGWNTQNDGLGTDRAVGSTFSITGSTTLYAKWTPYTITALSSNDSYGTVSLLGSVITGAPKDGYRYASPAYTVTGSATVSQDGNAFTVTPSSDCTVQINFEEIPSRTITATADGGTVTIKNGDDIVASGSSVREGTELAIIAAAGASKVFLGWSITGATPADEYAATTTFTVGASNVVVEAVFDDATTYEINWSVNGNIVKTENVVENEDLDFSAPASGIPANYVFKGWRDATLDKTDTDPDDYVTAATSTANITYYAVMAVAVSGTPTLTKMKSGDGFTAGDKVVIVAQDLNYGLYQEDASASDYVKNFNFDGKASSIAADDKTWWTVSVGSSAGKWIIGDATNGYLYSSASNNLCTSTENSTEFALSGTFNLKTCSDNRYLSCRSDLTSANKYLYRLGGTGGNGTVNFDIYKYVPATTTYTNFCTTVPTATVTIYAACTDGTNCYATYSNASSAFVVPEGLTVSTVSVSAGQLVMTEYSEGDVVKANIGVLLSVPAASAGDYTIVLTSATGTENDDNMLHPGLATADAMAAAYNPANYKFYKLALNNAGTANTAGFYYGAENGVQFASSIGKAFLAVPNDAAPNAPSHFMFNEEENNATNIETVEVDEEGFKFIQNGELFIKRNGVIYNALGQMVK